MGLKLDEELWSEHQLPIYCKTTSLISKGLGISSCARMAPAAYLAAAIDASDLCSELLSHANIEDEVRGESRWEREATMDCAKLNKQRRILMG